MKIEEDIIRIEEDAEKLVAAGKAEAKRRAAGLEEEKDRIAGEAETRFESESAELKKLYEGKLDRELAAAAEEGKREEKAAEESSRKVSDLLVRKIVESYQKT